MSFVSELKRRNVFRVGLAYLVAAWLLLQVTDVLTSVLGLPAFTGRFVFLLLVIGFVPALLFAWAYQVTPEGLRRDTGGAPAPDTARNLDRATMAMLVAVAGLVLFDRYQPREMGSEPFSETRSDATLSSSAEKGSDPISGTSPVTADSPPTIAVLPFVNMSDEEGNEYFADGLSEELLNLLVKIPELRVAARTSSFSFRDRDLTVAQIARELNVGHVLEGSVRKAGDRVRITAQLIEAGEGFHLWSETYDRQLVDIFAVQDEIASAVVEALKLQLLDQPTNHRVTQSDVYAHYLQGLYDYNKATREGFANAVQKLDAALAIEPEYAPALALRASAYLFEANSTTRPFHQGVEDARRSVLEALRIDPGLAFGWGVLSYIQSFYDWDFKAAEASVEQMQRLEPNAADTLHLRSNLENMLGRFESSIELRERAIRLDPLNYFYRTAQSYTLLATGQFNRAETLLREMLGDSPDYRSGRWRLVKIRLLQHDLEGAAELASSMEPHNKQSTTIQAVLHQASGRSETARLMASELIDGDQTGEGHYYLSQFLAWTGDREGAFEHLSRAIDLRYRVLSYVLNEPFLYPIHDDPRWREQIARIGLLEAWLQVPAQYGGPAE